MFDALQVWWTIQQVALLCKKRFPSTRSCRFFYLRPHEQSYSVVLRFAQICAFTLTRKKAPRFVLPFVSFWIIVAWLAKRQNALKFGKVSALREFLVKISKRRTRENSRPTCCVNINSVTPRASYHLSHSSAVLYVTLLFASIHQIWCVNDGGTRYNTDPADTRACWIPCLDKLCAAL